MPVIEVEPIAVGVLFAIAALSFVAAVVVSLFAFASVPALVTL